jgi:hypothetical protein
MREICTQGNLRKETSQEKEKQNKTNKQTKKKQVWLSLKPFPQPLFNNLLVYFE